MKWSTHHLQALVASSVGCALIVGYTNHPYRSGIIDWLEWRYHDAALWALMGGIVGASGVLVYRAFSTAKDH